MREARLERLGLVAYEAGLEWQRAAAAALRVGGVEALAVLEHEPVYTLGTRGDARHVLATPQALAARGARVVATDRGGDVTFHGPGQLVVYPVLDLRARGMGPAAHVRALEGAVLDALARWGVEGERVAGRPGVWAAGAKVAAVGVRIRDGVSTHGLALNVSTDLRWFDAIVPCGIADAGVTSLAALLGARAPTLREGADALVASLGDAFALRLVERAEAGAA
ncbi:MAG: lipoyl(octanoyl) transferase LipB [Chloroflexi bacterium]|nr:lipoyl(octanoyl) transferase LipB [Chloroflexota bacterium]